MENYRDFDNNYNEQDITFEYEVSAISDPREPVLFELNIGKDFDVTFDDILKKYNFNLNHVPIFSIPMPNNDVLLDASLLIAGNVIEITLSRTAKLSDDFTSDDFINAVKRYAKVLSRFSIDTYNENDGVYLVMNGDIKKPQSFENIEQSIIHFTMNLIREINRIEFLSKH